MKKFCSIISVMCAILVLGLVGGVSGGEPISNLLWCIPLFFIAYITGYIGGHE